VFSNGKERANCREAKKKRKGMKNAVKYNSNYR
jgi:hypothetical protein